MATTEKTIEIPEAILQASNMKYDNTASELKATNAQEALDEIYAYLNYKGAYTGNIDELLGVENCGGYIVVSSNASGTQPFNDKSYYLELPIQGNGRTQRAIHIVTGEIRERFYTDNKWYSWTPTKQNAIHSNIGFLSTGIDITINDGGYAITNDDRRWRLHANGTKFWIHEFDLDKKILNFYIFEDGNLTATGDLIATDTNNNKVSLIDSNTIDNTEKVIGVYGIRFGDRFAEGAEGG